MVILFYNKHLLRALVAITGAAIMAVAWRYVELSAVKLPEYGARDALAIVSFMVAGWLVMLIAEVIDNHYLRVFGCMSMLLGALVSFKWIFIKDGPRLVDIPDIGQAGMQFIQLSYWLAVGAVLVMLVLLVVRLVLDKQNLGRSPSSYAMNDESVEDEILQSLADNKPAELEAIPIDTSAINAPVASANVGTASIQPAARELTPVGKLTGIGGVYLGSSFDLAAGETSVGRQDCGINLPDDKQVSRSHAKITLDDAGLAQLCDLSSTNGVFLNSERVTQIGITPGDVIQIGTTMFKVEA